MVAILSRGEIGPHAERGPIATTAEVTSGCSAEDTYLLGPLRLFIRATANSLRLRNATARAGYVSDCPPLAAALSASPRYLSGTVFSRFHGRRRTCNERWIWVTDAEGISRVRPRLRNPRERSLRRGAPFYTAILTATTTQPTPIGLATRARTPHRTLDFSVARNQNAGTRTGPLIHERLIFIAFRIDQTRLPTAGSRHRPFFFWCVIGPSRRTREHRWEIGGKASRP